jgi:hypothetical protein
VLALIYNISRGRRQVAAARRRCAKPEGKAYGRLATTRLHSGSARLTWLPLSVGSAAADPKKGGILAYATVSGPGGLDPHVSSSAVELEVIHNLFEPLVTLDNQNATKTMLAAKASASADAKTTHSSFAKASSSTTATR